MAAFYSADEILELAQSNQLTATYQALGRDHCTVTVRESGKLGMESRAVLRRVGTEWQEESFSMSSTIVTFCGSGPEVTSDNELTTPSAPSPIVRKIIADAAKLDVRGAVRR